MSGALRSPLKALAPAAWLRLPRRTARLRLTILYSGLFLLSGTCVMVIVYLLASGGPAVTVTPARGGGATIAVARPAPQGQVPQAPGAPLVGRRDLGSLIKHGVAVQRHADLARLLEAFWFVLAISAIPSAVLGWFAAGRVLRPLRAITTKARTISAGNLHERLALTGPADEFKQLGDTLDGLLGRLEASFEAQRRFVANASHELRTPLTVERTLLQVALADPTTTADEFRSMCEELLTVGAEHERLLEALLTLATSDRGLDCREPLDLSAVTTHVLQSSNGEIDRRSLHLESYLAPAPTTGDPALIERLVANLVDNAASHNVPDGWVRVRTETDGGHALVEVANTGPLVAATEIDRLFEPFQRLDGKRSLDSNGHFGLGLSIVRAIANAHDATLHAQPRPDGGLAITVLFPQTHTAALFVQQAQSPAA